MRLSHDLRHYGVVLKPGVFEVWEASLDGQNYRLRRVANGDSFRAAELKQLVNWINAIHAWALTAHAESIMKDLEEIWNAAQGMMPTPPPLPPSGFAGLSNRTSTKPIVEAVHGPAFGGA
ncbi:MAG: hypothetical protein M1826_002378 [Phylliscum demangeonii]|nr:MAG: hypothetical protein M1826_002378 [Phylliscum demangeonii]